MIFSRKGFKGVIDCRLIAAAFAFRTRSKPIQNVGVHPHGNAGFAFVRNYRSPPATAEAVGASFPIRPASCRRALSFSCHSIAVSHLELLGELK